LNIEYFEFSLEGLLDGIDSLVRPAAAEKGLEFSILQNEKTPVRIISDQTRLRQCLINLISNAIKFTESGHVHVTVSLDKIDEQAFLTFEIEDTGIGIPTDKQKHIFDSFNQADNSHSRRYGGTGLGLAITKQLTELLGGELSVASGSNRGSIFKMTIPTGVGISDQPLPKTDETALDDKIKNSEKIQLSGHILLAEDSVPNQTLMKILLEKAGLKMTIAADGGQAVHKALEHEYDLILMDMQMPIMNGDQATMELRQKGLTTPIVALTANAMEGDDKKCIEAGCDDYLPKPIIREDLMNVLKKYLCPADAREKSD
jgi:CheY-like chemotaxis protein/anti-sigma regulatory factor (Ser/Thr protein kinase)